MEIQIVKKQKNGYLINDTITVGDGYSGWLLEPLNEWLANNDPEADFTEEEELAKQELFKQLEQKKVKMLEGEVYTLNNVDYTISFTKDDGNGVVQVKSAFDLGVTSTIIHFENGTKLPMTEDEFPEFALWFVEKRNSFFEE